MSAKTEITRQKSDRPPGIRQLYVFVFKDQRGHESIVSIDIGGVEMDAVCCTEHAARRMAHHVQAKADQLGESFRLLCFTDRTDVTEAL